MAAERVDFITVLGCRIKLGVQIVKNMGCIAFTQFAAPCLHLPPPKLAQKVGVPSAFSRRRTLLRTTNPACPSPSPATCASESITSAKIVTVFPVLLLHGTAVSLLLLGGHVERHPAAVGRLLQRVRWCLAYIRVENQCHLVHGAKFLRGYRSR